MAGICPTGLDTDTVILPEFGFLVVSGVAIDMLVHS